MNHTINHYNGVKPKHLYLITLMLIAAYLGRPSLDRHLQYEYCLSKTGAPDMCMAVTNVLSLLNK